VRERLVELAVAAEELGGAQLDERGDLVDDDARLARQDGPSRFSAEDAAAVAPSRYGA